MRALNTFNPLPALINIMKNKFFYQTTLIVALFAAAINLHAHNGIRVSPKVFLKAPMGNDGLMRDDLRTKGLIPTSEPYSSLPNFQHFGSGGGETIADPNVLSVSGENAIVDWVLVEIRSDANLTTPIATRSALLQRDGDVVSVDGASPVQFLEVAPGQYHVSVRHRNHLGVMTADNISLSGSTQSVDFSNPNLPLYGTNAADLENGKRLLWLGKVSADKEINTHGAGNELDVIFFSVLLAPGNTNSNLNYIYKKYTTADVNMDGYVIYSGPKNDRSFIYSQLLEGCQNNSCNLIEQLP